MNRENFMSFTYQVTINVMHDTASEREDKDRKDSSHCEMDSKQVRSEKATA